MYSRKGYEHREEIATEEDPLPPQIAKRYRQEEWIRIVVMTG